MPSLSACMKKHYGQPIKFPGAKHLSPALKSAINARDIEAIELFQRHIASMCIVPSDYSVGIELLQKAREYSEERLQKNSDDRLTTILSLLTNQEGQFRSYLQEDELRMNAYIEKIRKDNHPS